MPIRVQDREELGRLLTDADIGWGIHYPIAPGDSQAYRRTDMPVSDLPNSSSWAEEEMSLPLTPGMSHDDQDRVIEVLRGAFA